MTKSLPANPNLKHLRLEAKALLKTHKSSDSTCCKVLRGLHQFNGKSDEEILKAEVGLQEVQFALAIEYGFTSWQEMKKAVEATPAVAVGDDGDAAAKDAFRSIVLDAVADGATDLHLEPMDHGVRVRRRVDGCLYEIASLSEDQGQDVIAAAMQMGGLDPEQRNISQDGRFDINVDDGRIDCFMNSVPGSRGTVLAIRPIDTRKTVFSIDRLDFEADQEERYRSLIGGSHGVVVVTGPTGSGKTTTLYATLSELNDPSRKIMTIEDPVECSLEGIDQLPVSPEFGFETALRSVLRQAPNVLLVGEIRSLPVVNIIIQAALTGHLVFATLHADTSPGAYARMMDMGLAPFLVRDAVRGILAQRLLRKLCPHCKEEHASSTEQLAQLGMDSADAHTLWRAVGCDACEQRGYKGRLCVFSLLEMNDRVSKALMTKDATAIEAAAKATGWQSLREIAIRKMLRGDTTLEEVIKFT